MIQIKNIADTIYIKIVAESIIGNTEKNTYIIAYSRLIVYTQLHQ